MVGFKLSAGFRMAIGKGFVDRQLTSREVHDLSAEALETADLDNRRVLIIIPDSTRTAPIPQFFRLFHQLLSGRVKSLDFLVALGTHQPMSETSLNRLVGISDLERSTAFSDVEIFNHD